LRGGGEKYDYAVLGAGRQGTAAAYDMAKFGNARGVLLGDISLRIASKAAKRINVLCGQEIARAARVDATRQAQVKRFLAGMDAFVSAVPYYYNLQITKAAIRAGASMCDLGGNTEIVRRQLLLDKKAEREGISIVPDCGLGPGMSATLACYGMTLLDTTDEIYIWDGGLPQNPQPPFKYLLTFHFDGLANEYSGKAVYLRGGQIVEIPCFEELELLEFPPLGRLEAFTTSGGTSTCPWTFMGKLKVFQNKTLRYLGSYAQLKTMHDLGLFSDKEIRLADGTKVVPRQVLRALFEPKIRLPGEKDVVVLRVRCVGEKKNQPAEVVLDLIDYYDDDTKFTAMERTTGWHASIVAIMMANGATPRGVKPLEVAISGPAFVEELRRRGISLSERVNSLTA